jgi:glutamyl-Q tRNA(Asp) synthetase
MDQKAPYIVRFAPSPTGQLHIGHAFSALFTWKHAVDSGGRFILRIEDIDIGRCRNEFEQGIYEDLHWLGIEWEHPVRRQSEHFDEYRAALDKLDDMGLVYPCFCTRQQINDLNAPHGPDGVIYPGTCRHLSNAEREDRIAAGQSHALRLDIEAAFKIVSDDLTWHDLSKGEQKADPLMLNNLLGDVVIARKDVPTSYHLAVTLDDDLQGINLVTRGEDLFHATYIHRLLQALLGLNVPEYHHHGLMLDEEGKRFAKRNNAVTLQHLREVEGKSAADIVSMMNL